MASYTSEQLSGRGIATEVLTAATTYTFTLTTPGDLVGNAYFTLESVRDNDGFYDGQATNAIGSVVLSEGVGHLIQSPYILSVIIDNDGGSFTFTPTSTVPAAGALLRATGGVSLVVS